MNRTVALGGLVALVVAGALVLDATRLLGLQLTVPALAGVVVVGLVVVLRGPGDLGVTLLALAVATATWNGVSLGLPLGHLFLAAALGVLALLAVGSGARLAAPSWVWPLPTALLLVVACSVLFPIDRGYLTARFGVPIDAATAAAIPSPGIANLLNGVRWIVPALALPLAVCLAVAGREPGARTRLVRTLTAAWVLGAAVNAAVALADETGLTAISARFIAVDVGGRQAGLTAQPNHLALSVGLAAPVAVWFLLSTRGRERLLWAGATAVMGGGLFVSGSRGGLVVALGAVLVALLVDRLGRRLLLPLAGAALGAGTLLVAFFPTMLDRLGRELRLTGAESAAESDAIRARIHAQALLDIEHSPLRGIGLHVMTEGHSIYLQLGASGGALLFLGFVVTAVGALADGRAIARAGGPAAGLARALVVAFGAWLVVGVVENQIADLYLYVPLALLAGLAVSAGARPPSPQPVPALVRSPGEPS
ncbi:O-antigen ligase family protein [Actinomycetospora soli]|uniref:O-antigen ligase family protein n=1 Tax=Actinomycetospora soli TaxID=2893887 RepID=UPI001E57D46A|nr:O-antigen ligase family protein [Actinomycetospora soli]MCD2187742.1 O-antigen ligase family protein [Actinomycetospora soli]